MSYFIDEENDGYVMGLKFNLGLLIFLLKSF